MGLLQVKKLWAVCALLVLTLSFCDAKNATVKLVGILQCTDCFNNHSSSSDSSLGFDVFITCNARKNETKTQGNGGVDKQGKFNVTLEEDAKEIDGCYAKLQSRSGAPCHIQEPQTASVEVLSNGEKEAVTTHQHTVIKFSPLTCQSAFFWPFPNLTFFGYSPPSPPEYIPPPSPENLPPVAAPVQPPVPPPENSPAPPQPSNDPPLPPPEIDAPSPPPSAGSPAAAPPTYQNPTDPEIGSPSSPPQALPTLPVYGKPPPIPPPSSPPLPPRQAPAVNGPIQSPTPPATVVAPPTPALASSPPPTLPSPEKPVPPPPAATVPGQRRPSPIPKAPPIPRLPLTPSIPRKYFNAPNSKSKPPHV